MNKAAIRNYAVWARIALIKACTQKAFELGITAENCKNRNTPKSAQVLKPNGQPLSGLEQGQRDALLRQLSTKGFEQVMEEAAYTWFNRFIALKYMQEHSLLPLAMKALPGRDGQHPEMLSQALKIQLNGLDREKVYTLLERSDSEGLYKALLIALCNSLSESLPQMFEAISDYTELLFPDGLLKPDSVLSALSSDIPVEDWKSIEIVGWLYQFYNTELKDETFALLKKNVKISKERIGAATQLFTPEWIVKYMVENSLGRLWLEGHPGAALRSGMKYYLDEAEQEPEVREQLGKIREGYRRLRPEDIKVIDPCMGSGHILVYAFDLLMGIYRQQGYTDRDAVESIVRKNLWGLDIDDRAAQLAYFAVMMKAAQYDSQFLSRGIQPNLFAIQESNGLDAFNELYGQMDLSFTYVQAANDLIEQFRDAKVYGSLIDVQMPEIPDRFMERLQLACMKHLQTADWFSKARETLPALIDQARLLSRKYDVVVTNPPYMGSGGMDTKLSDYVKAFYPDSKSDMSTVFMQKSLEVCNDNGYMSMINIPVWMFLSSFEMLRKILISNNTFINMLHLGRGVFGSDFGTTAFIISRRKIAGYTGNYQRLFMKQGAVDSLEQKQAWFLYGLGRYTTQQDNYNKVPGSPIAYWLTDNAGKAFKSGKPLSKLGQTTKGFITGDNDRFLRQWWEVSESYININSTSIQESVLSGSKWFPCNKGGDYRKWYGNRYYIVNWKNDGNEILNVLKNEKRHSQNYYSHLKFKPGISWSSISISKPSFRFIDKDLVDHAGMAYFSYNKAFIYPILGFLNSCVSTYYLEFLSPTINYNAGEIGNLPIVLCDHQKNEIIIGLAKNSVSLTKNDWDSFEASWDFIKHPLI